jgi:hypothetical protein
MLIHDGDLHDLGDPEETALRYYRLNFGGDQPGAEPQPGGVPDVNVKILEGSLRNEAGERVDNVEQGQPIGLDVLFEARHDLDAPTFGFHFLNANGETVFGFNRTLAGPDGEPGRVAAGERVRVAGRIDNPLLPGRYFVTCWISRNRTQGDLALHIVRLLDFVVYGTKPGPGSVSVNAEVEASLDVEAVRAP